MMRKTVTGGGGGAAASGIMNTTTNPVAEAVTSNSSRINNNSCQIRSRSSLHESQQQSTSSSPGYHYYLNHHGSAFRPPPPPIVTCCMPWYLVAVMLCCFYVVYMMLVLRFIAQQQELQQQLSHGVQLPLGWLVQNRESHNRGQVEGQHSRLLLDGAQVQQLQQWEQQLGLISCRRRSASGTVQYAATAGRCPVVTAAGLSNEKGNQKYQTNPVITLFNPMHHERYLCRGKIRIEAHGTTQIDRDTWNAPECRISDNDDQSLPFASLFPVIPDVTGQGMDPVTLRFVHDPTHRIPTRPFTDCDIPCHHSGSPPSVNAIRTIDHILATPTTNARGAPQGMMKDWSFTFSMEGPEYFPNLVMNTTAWRQGSFYATTSYLSEVPLPYFSWAEYEIQSPAVDFDQSEPAIVFLAHNCKSKNNREDVVRTLQRLHEEDPVKYIRIDSLSSCLYNANPPPGVDLDDKRQTMRRYRFYLAAENQCINDYITEKLWGALESGTLPVYFGAPNIHEHVPPHSIIAVNDFPSIAALSEYLQQLAQNRTTYKEYHAWRKHPLPSHFHTKYDFTAIHSTCRMCRWAYARMYGVGWYHANQSLVYLQTPRQVCVDPDTGLLQHFIRDVSWLGIVQSTPSGEANNGKSIQIVPLHVEPVPLQYNEMQDAHHDENDPCDLYHHSRILDLDYGQFRRTAVSMDGILDVYLDHSHNGHETATSWSVVQWRFELPFSVKNDVPMIQFIDAGHVRIQTSISRITILFDPPSLQLQQDAAASSSSSYIDKIQLTVDIPVNAFPIRMRFIVEDVDRNEMHEGADQAENFFGSVMKQDFVLPLEAFIETADKDETNK